MKLVVAAVAGMAIAVLATPLAMRIARRTGLVDRPGPLKLQSTPVAYLGGAAVLAATLPGLFLGRLPALGPLGGALLLGVADDWLDLSPAFRLVGQVAVGAAICAVVPLRLAVPFGWFAAVAVTVVLMNGVNMMDGLDAMVAGSMLPAALAAALLLAGGPRVLSLAVAGAVAGFLLYNWPPARIYLGDGGAYLLGAWLALTVCWAWGPRVPVATSVTMLLLGAVPAAEVAFAVVRRLRARRPVVGGDRAHPYDLLVARGWGTKRPVLAYLAVQSVLCASAVVAGRLHSLAGGLAAVGVGAVALLCLAQACGALDALEEASG